MRALALGFVMLASCIDFSLGQKSSSSSDAGSSSTSSTDASSDSGVSGTSCGQDPNTGVTLCLGVSSCPGLTIDSQAFPGCGFRVSGGSTLDLECACSDYVCPIGVASSCTQAKQLLESQTQPMVCAQVNDGRCTQGTPTQSTTPAGCDKTCASECGGDPTCIKACGC